MSPPPATSGEKTGHLVDVSTEPSVGIRNGSDSTSPPPATNGERTRRAKITREPTFISPANHNSRPRQLVRKELQDEESGHPMVELPPRLVRRDRTYFQSSNKLHIRHNQGPKILSLLRHNWYHALLRWKTMKSSALLLALWTAAIIVFACLYVLYDYANTTKQCRLGKPPNQPISFGGAFAFSLETCTTVGYGLPNGINSYFEKCQGLQFIIYLQMVWSMVFNAFLITFLYTRMGRSESRGTQVVYSNKALVSVVDGQVRFQLRLFDVDAARPVVEAHVRLYVVTQNRPVPRPLRILQPNDELGGMLFLSFPSVVSHHIDLYSLLHPPADQISTRPSGLVLRQVDGMTANRDDVICPVCGESYGTMERWRSHVSFQQIVENKEGYPVQGTHRSLDLKEIDEQIEKTPTTDLDVLKKNFQDNISEVICVVEGIDPIMSGTFQSLQSYRFEDIIWDADTQFAPCMEIVNSMEGRFFQVDLDRYHDMYVIRDKQPLRPKQSSLREGDKFFSTNSLTARKARKERRSSPPSSHASGDESKKPTALASLFQSPNEN